jgi:heme exporter protein A
VHSGTITALSEDHPVTDTAAVLELTDVEISRGGRVLASGLSFALAPGQLALLSGPNGSGKTTLLRLLAGLARPGRGAIRLHGQDVATLDPVHRQQIAYQAHLDGLKKDLSIDENISFYSSLYGIPDVNTKVLDELGLTAIRARKTRHLSAGQKRRTALAILATVNAPVWLLDEPLTNLDRAGRKLVAQWLERHLQRGGVAVVATHLVAELERPGCLRVDF